MKRRALAVLLSLVSLVLFVALSLAASPASAQTYRFALEQEVVHVYLNGDGTLDLEYTFLFANDKDASPIDFVDVGLPDEEYLYGDLSHVRAEVNGQPIEEIAPSPYVFPGLALALGEHAIRPGERGEVHVFIPGVKAQYYPDTTSGDYASFQFSPTWFGEEFVHGESDITVTFHLPPGVAPAEPRWHEAPEGFPAEPETGFDEEGRITYTWHNPQANGFTQYIFGLSIPRQYVLSAIVLAEKRLLLTITPEGALDVYYFLAFKNDSRNTPLSQFSLRDAYGYRSEVASLQAAVDGTPLAADALSVEYGDIHLDLGEQAIQSGQSGTVEVRYLLTGQTFTSSWYQERYRRVKLDFEPAGFTEDWLFGPTDLTVRVTLPPGLSEADLDMLTPDDLGEPRFEHDAEGHLVLLWEVSAVSPSTPQYLDLEMPSGVVPESAVYRFPPPGLLERLGIDEDTAMLFSCIAFIAGVIVVSTYQARRRKMQYFPPKIKIEGHGIKRGLTAVEAAILMEQPLDKVMT
ncbi:MAG: hypothetical protein D6770_07515, partial [Anaerolineae bacterium]